MGRCVLTTQQLIHQYSRRTTAAIGFADDVITTLNTVAAGDSCSNCAWLLRVHTRLPAWWTVGGLQAWLEASLFAVVDGRDGPRAALGRELCLWTSALISGFDSIAVDSWVVGSPVLSRSASDGGSPILSPRVVSHLAVAPGAIVAVPLRTAVDSSLSDGLPGTRYLRRSAHPPSAHMRQGYRE